jgi:hypothetical protein
LTLYWEEDRSQECIDFIHDWVNSLTPGNNGQETLIKQLKVDATCLVTLQADFPVIETQADGTYCEITSSHPEAIEYFIEQGYGAFLLFTDAMSITTLDEPPTFNRAEEVRQEVVHNFLDAVRG